MRWSSWHRQGKCEEKHRAYGVFLRAVGSSVDGADRGADRNPESGNWGITILPGGEYCLCCKWGAKNPHVVLLGPDYYYSDIPYEEVRESEGSFQINPAVVQTFLEQYPGSLLDNYVNHGGQRVFSFILSPGRDHVMELLGKAGLSRIADHLDSYHDLNWNGSCIEDIFGLPLRCMRAFNFGNDDMLLFPEDRELISQAYRQAPEVFDVPFSELSAMWVSLYYQNDRDLVFVPDNLGKTIRYLNRQCRKDGNPYNIFGLYQNYLSYCTQIGRVTEGLYPRNLEGAVKNVIATFQIEREAVWQRRRMLKEQERAETFRHTVEAGEYTDLTENLDCEDYCICAPDEAEDMIHAGSELHNCLSGYIDRISEGYTKVLFIRKRLNNELLGAIEVRGSTVIQYRGKCNLSLPAEVQEYVDGYFERKGLTRMESDLW